MLRASSTLYLFCTLTQNAAYDNRDTFITNNDICLNGTAKNSRFYDVISDFTFGEFDYDSYARSLDYLKSRDIKLTKNNIRDIPEKWVIEVELEFDEPDFKKLLGLR